MVDDWQIKTPTNLPTCSIPTRWRRGEKASFNWEEKKRNGAQTDLLTELLLPF